jgi:1-phosphatidylinositol phosphodiesterase
MKNTHPGYSYDTAIGTHNTDWMAKVNGDKKINTLSLPGTHDSLATKTNTSVLIAQTQSMSLATQLESGIRALDIRTRHIDDEFHIYHGIIDLHTKFEEVLTTVNSFLDQHPTEFVLMYIQSESTPQNNKLSYGDVFMKYMNDYGQKVWNSNEHRIPSLNEVRGRIVITHGNTSGGSHTMIPYNKEYDCGAYGLSGNSDLYDKWIKTKAHINSLSNQTNFENYFYYTSLNDYMVDGLIVLPYFVASGKSSAGTSDPYLSTGFLDTSTNEKYPDFFRSNGSILFTGINILAYEHLKATQNSVKSKFIGVISADFPGSGLIEVIINRNY